MTNVGILDLLESTFKDDLKITLSSDGKLKISGSDEAVEKWLPILK